MHEVVVKEIHKALPIAWFAIERRHEYADSGRSRTDRLTLFPSNGYPNAPGEHLPLGLKDGWRPRG